MEGHRRPYSHPLELGDYWFAKVVSPRDPGDLEGRHADVILVVIEESDKAYITDDNDRMVAICNPPKDESNPNATGEE